MLLCVGIKGLIRIRVVIIRFGIVIVIRDVIISRVCVEIMGENWNKSVIIFGGV